MFEGDVENGCKNNWECLQKNTNPQAIEMVKGHVAKGGKINWDGLAMNPNPRAIEMLEEYAAKGGKINYDRLAMNPNPRAIEMLEEYKAKGGKINRELISRNYNHLGIGIVKKYKEKGFTVICISLNQPGKREAWLKEINKDGLNWTQLSDLNSYDNAVAKKYNVDAIPQNFLIDPSGKIVAKNIRGEALGIALAKLLK